MSIWLNLKALIIAFQKQFKGDFVSEILGFGIAGNFALHLEQAGEADDFALVKTDDEYAPKGIFPFYQMGKWKCQKRKMEMTKMGNLYHI